jgi:hypothetical protein
MEEAMTHPQGASVPKGWKQIEVGEMVEAGDKFWSESYQKWIPLLGPGYNFFNHAVIRKIKKSGKK